MHLDGEDGVPKAVVSLLPHVSCVDLAYAALYLGALCDDIACSSNGDGTTRCHVSPVVSDHFQLLCPTTGVPRLVTFVHCLCIKNIAIIMFSLPSNATGWGRTNSVVSQVKLALEINEIRRLDQNT